MAAIVPVDDAAGRECGEDTATPDEEVHQCCLDIVEVIDCLKRARCFCHDGVRRRRIEGPAKAV